MNYIVSQTFETLGDPCTENYATREEAENAACELRALIADMVANMATPTSAPSNLGNSTEIEAWNKAHELCGWQWDEESDDSTGPAKYGQEVGKYIADQSVTIEEEED